ncbi:J domain-containing protein [Actinomadura sp. 9N407]|uniref:J domain-containing protein n=1 Tax=Actinomadura sp. 9N407 TaxID=3375154 RepID=UPI0037A30B48
MPFPELAGNDAYALLDVRPTATGEEIRRAHRDLIKENHPDRFTDPERQAEAAARTRLLNAARQVLITRRIEYDASRPAPPPPWWRRPRGQGGPRKNGRIALFSVLGWGALALLVTLLLRPSNEPVTVPASMIGSWGGTVTHLHAPMSFGRFRTYQESWSAELTLRRDGGRVSYLDGSCSGTAAPLALSGGTLVLKAEVTRESEECDLGDARLRPRDDGDLSVEFRGRNGMPPAEGVLRRR